MIVSIDYRSATGQLYALSSMSRLYHINENSDAATAYQGANPSLGWHWGWVSNLKKSKKSKGQRFSGPFLV